MELTIIAIIIVTLVTGIVSTVFLMVRFFNSFTENLARSHINISEDMTSVSKTLSDIIPEINKLNIQTVERISTASQTTINKLADHNYFLVQTLILIAKSKDADDIIDGLNIIQDKKSQSEEKNWYGSDRESGESVEGVDLTAPQFRKAKEAHKPTEAEVQSALEQGFFG